MSDKSECFLYGLASGIAAIAIFWILIMLLLGYGGPTTQEHRRAVEAGHAHYVISDESTGDTQFEWYPPCNVKETE